jgi:hypothetical protein
MAAQTKSRRHRRTATEPQVFKIPSPGTLPAAQTDEPAAMAAGSRNGEVGAPSGTRTPNPLIPLIPGLSSRLVTNAPSHLPLCRWPLPRWVPLFMVRPRRFPSVDRPGPSLGATRC